MDIGESQINYAEAPSKLIKLNRRTPLGQLEEQKKEFEQRLADINAAIEALKNNPEITNVLEMLAKVNLNLR